MNVSRFITYHLSVLSINHIWQVLKKIKLANILRLAQQTQVSDSSFVVVASSAKHG